MPALIGTGSHAADITWTTYISTVYASHTDYDPNEVDEVIIAVNDSQTRASIAAELGIRDIPWVHPDAHMHNDCRWGYGTHINYGVHAVRTVLGDHVTLAPGVIISGDVTIGDRVFVGAGAVVSNLVNIGNDAIIGAGAVVLTDVPAGETWVGVPAKKL